MFIRLVSVQCFLLALPLSAAAQQAPPDYGHNFITIGDVGNPGYTGLDPFMDMTGRGAVNYEYRISRTEVTSGQYADYLNARIEAGFPASTIRVPRLGGVIYDFVNDQWITQAGGDMLPVGGISWRNAAIYMNWLHNGKGTDAADFMSGAYDIATFGTDPNDPSSFTDQSSRSPGAQYWIPSHDEWFKAAHWDPNKNGPGQGGYWEFSHTSDTKPIPGLPGVGETSADLAISDEEAFQIPLESYPDTQSPWGLLDVSGGGAEWTERWFTLNGADDTELRVWDGAGAGNTTISRGDSNFDPILGIDRTTDRHWEYGAFDPDEPTRPYLTFRIASAIPAPGVGAPLLAVSVSMLARRRRRFAAVAFTTTTLPLAAQQAPPDYGHNFITIGDAGNVGYDREDLRGRTTGRGSVGYEYRISRTEVTSAQWAEFMNAVDSAGGSGASFQPLFWGGFNDGSEWTTQPDTAMLPTTIDWRDAAIYCNWLHHGKPTDDLNAFNSGAYDVSTFGVVPGTTRDYTDQTSRSPGARYWIPSLDEWLKAAHYDPNKDGAGDGGWWLYNNGSDTQPVPGLPGVGETAAGLDFGFGQEFTIPLEAYPDTQSPWGLLDLSGGAGEWTEEWLGGTRDSGFRVFKGNVAGQETWDPGDPIFFSNDLAWEEAAERPNFGFDTSLRIASLVPCPATASVAVPVFIFSVRRRRS